jgi:hypothetical protein
MIPINDDLIQDFELEVQPTKTYRLNQTKATVNGAVDGLSAIEQAIYKIINTERYSHLIYSWNYGIEFADLFGKPIPYVYPEIKRRITEALLQDDRITSVSDFFFSNQKGRVLTQFKVYTTEGEVSIEKVVNI